MLQEFIHIATVRFYHDYFGDRPFDSVTVSLAPSSGSRLVNLGWVIKGFRGGFHLITSDLESLKGEKDPILLHLNLKDSLFYNYTEIGRSDYLDKVFFFSNHSGSAKGKLHKKDKVSGSDLIKVNHRGWRTDVKYKGSVRSLAGDKIGELPGDLNFPEDEESVIQFHNDSTEENIYCKDAGSFRVPFGVMALYPQVLAADFSDGGLIVYTITFSAKETVWKYILSDKVYDKFKQLAVVDAGSKTCVFTAGEFDISDNHTVRCFESDSKIPLHAVENPRFQLVEKPVGDQRMGRVVVRQLPKAIPDHLYPAAENPDILYSHIFI